MTHFVWGGSALPPSERKSPKIPIKTVPKGVSIVHFLGCVCETLIHWNPAAGRRGKSDGHRQVNCPHCRAGISLRVNGYAPVLWYEDFWQQNGVPEPVHVQRWTVAVVSCPEALTGDLQEQPAVAGLTFRFEREKTSSPVIRFMLFDASKLATAIPSVEPFDVHPIVERAWGYRRIEESAPQPVSAPVEAPEAADDRSPDEQRADEHAQIRRLKHENRQLKERLKQAESVAKDQPPPASVPVRTFEDVKADLADKFNLNGKSGNGSAPTARQKGGAA